MRLANRFGALKVRSGTIACAWLGQAGYLLKTRAGRIIPFARHALPDAIGFLLTIDGVRLWHSGDTEYDEHLRRLATHEIGVAFLCINGGGGNMNAYEAALLAWQVKPLLVVPMHYGMWSAEDYTYRGEAPDATPDPTLFASTLAKLDPKMRVQELQVGRPVRFA